MAISKEEREEQRLKRLATLRSSYEMYERTKEDTKKRHKTAKDKHGNKMYSESDTKKNLELLTTMQQDIFDEYIGLGGNPDELKISKKTGVDRRALEELMKREAIKDEMTEMIKSMNEDKENTEEKYGYYPNNDDISKYAEESIKVHEKEEKKIKKTTTYDKEDTSSGKKQMYDFVNLPSKGLCYKNRISKVKVAYLTAYDENMILSPNLYKEGTFLEYLLEAKILDDINVQDMLPGDRDAIILWLRANGYGNNYPLVITDPKTGTDFSVDYDLSQIKFKEFNLEPDDNGYFDFTLPISKDVIKFKFLSLADMKFLNKLKNKESKRLTVFVLKNIMNQLDELITDNEHIDNDIAIKIGDLSEKIHDDIVQKYDEKTDISFTHELTDRLVLHTVSINGIKDRNYIKDYISNMNVKDAAEYRKYISEHEPGINYNITVEKPASLGGGSMSTFLQFNQFIFINI
jgi:hypothetical protein